VHTNTSLYVVNASPAKATSAGARGVYTQAKAAHGTRAINSRVGWRNRQPPRNSGLDTPARLTSGVARSRAARSCARRRRRAHIRHPSR